MCVIISYIMNKNTLIRLLITIILIYSSFGESQPFVKQTIYSQSALCLDGSPSIIYVSKGDPHKILLHFQSGGWCGEPTLPKTIESCYQRSLTAFGSSKYSPSTMNFSYGILSNSLPNMFIGWTRIFLAYCDGAGHQGSRTEPIKYKNASLYFRGTNITLERFDYLEENYGLFSKTEEVVLSGASAGGLATYFWGDYLKSKLKKASYLIVADSGIFLNALKFSTKSEDYLMSFRHLMELSNEQIDPPNKECVERHKLNKQLCMFAQNLILDLKSLVFVVQSLYDSWSILNILGITCAINYEMNGCTVDQRSYIEEYRRNTSRVLESVQNLKQKNGYWANGCVYHGYTYFGAYNSLKFRIPSGSQNSISACLENWNSNQGNSYYIDSNPWPDNIGCSNSQLSLE